MRYATGILALASTLTNLASGSPWLSRRRMYDGRTSLPVIPEYNVSMPVDHFNQSDTRVYNNRFFVNDTYYRPGGPVILFDVGESGASPYIAALSLAGFNGTISAPLEVAKELGGVVVAWEHRYYGYSKPFVVSNEINTTDNARGIPDIGPKAYEYLTAEQALEDLVYFANQFNTTKLHNGNTVLGGENATRHLGPNDTPWLFIGGSYPGTRAAWARIRNPEIFYAAWASSAPVQAQPDGTAYRNSIFRSLPNNCREDLQAAFWAIDNVVTADTDISYLQRSSDLAYNSADDYKNTNTFSALHRRELVTRHLLTARQNDYGDWPAELAETETFLFNPVQGSGFTWLRKFCDNMERFDANTYLSDEAINSNNNTKRAYAWYNNPGNHVPTDKGIAASNSNSDQVILAAFFFAMSKWWPEFSKADLYRSRPKPEETLTPYSDNYAYTWQVYSQLGLIQATNMSSPYALGSRFNNFTTELELYRGAFSSLLENYPEKLDHVPEGPNATFALDTMGGWDMTPSNVMFTNGEFDPWRAYSVMSLDQEIGAPERFVTQDVPKCGQPPNGTDVFGLLYKGGVHVEDMIYEPKRLTGSPETGDNAPVYQGARLFAGAYRVWLPCFNESRGRTTGENAANGTGGVQGGSGNDQSAGGKMLPTVAGLWASVLILVLLV